MKLFHIVCAKYEFQDGGLQTENTYIPALYTTQLQNFNGNSHIFKVDKFIEAISQTM